MLIYKIVNKQNGNFYIGMTSSTLKDRWQSHLNTVSKGRTVLYKAMRSYGIDNFYIELIEQCTTVEQMNDREDFYLKTLNPHYNMRLTGGTGGDTSYTENHINSRHKMATSKSTVWYNNGKDQKRLKPGTQPLDWVPGRLFKCGKHPKKITTTFEWVCTACGNTKILPDVKPNRKKQYCNLKCSGSTIASRRVKI